MSTIKVSVASSGVGWTVEADGVFQPVAFFSGGRAEAYARGVSIASARAGYHTYLTVRDAGGHVVGKRFYPAEANAEAVA
jgi:hypothetical protein